MKQKIAFGLPYDTFWILVQAESKKKLFVS